MNPVRRQQLSRVVIAQLSTGHILDLAASRLLQNEVPDVREETRRTGAGDHVVRGRETSLELRLFGREEVELGKLMASEGCPCMAVALSRPGGRHMLWNEPARVRIREASSGRGAAEAILVIRTDVIEPAIFTGMDLLEGAAWTSMSASPVDAVVTSAEVTGYAQTDNARAGWGIAETGGTIYVADPAGHIYIWDSEIDLGQGIEPRIRPAPVGIQDIDVTSLGEIYAIVDDDVVEIAEDGTTIDVITGVGTGVTGVAIDNTQVWVSREDGSGGREVVRFFSDGTEDLTWSLDSTTVYALGNSGSTLYALTEAGLVRPDPGTDIVLDSSLDGRGVDYNASSRYYIPSTQDRVIVTTSGEDTTYDLQETGLIASPAYQGPTWRLPGTASVDAVGVASNIDTGTPAVIEAIAPIPGAVLDVDGAEFHLEALGWDRQRVYESTNAEMDTGSGVYADLAVAAPVWAVRLTVNSTTARPRLLIADPGTPLGARPGGLAPTCAERTAAPEWQISVFAFDVIAAAGQETRIALDGDASDVTSLQAGDDVVPWTSDQQSITWTSSGRRTVALFANTFAGITTVDIKGAVVLDTIDMAMMVTASELRVTAQNDQGAGFAPLSGRLQPEAVTDTLFIDALQKTGAQVSLTDVAAARSISLINVDVLSPTIVDTSWEEVYLIGCNGSFPLTEWDLSGLTRLSTSFSQGIHVAVDEIEAPALTRSIHRVGSTSGDLRQLLETSRSLEAVHLNGHSGDLRGVTASGNPVMPPNLETARKVGYADGPINDWSNADALINFQMVGNGNLRNSMYGLLAALQSGVDMSQCSIEFGVSSDHNHSLPCLYYDYEVWVSILAEALRPAFISPNQSPPGEILSITDTECVVRDPNALLKGLWDDAVFNDVYGSQNNQRPQLGIYYLDGGDFVIPDIQDAEYGDSTSPSHVASDPSWGGVDTTTFPFLSAIAPRILGPYPTAIVQGDL